VIAVDRTQKIILISLIAFSASSWLVSQFFQQDMMAAMSSLNAISVSFFVSIWTVGMAAMMFPAITPMMFLYNRLTNSGGGDQAQASVHPVYAFKTLIFVGCYLAVWSVAGIVLLLGWSAIMDTAMVAFGQSLPYVYGAILLIAGAYQFSSLKTKCLGYCESPMSFFMKRWSSGTKGAVKMGLYHGLYCLGCCWPYFLLMIALGWMNLFWMALFSAIIFAEKIWSKGIWIARAAGIGFAIIGILALTGIISGPPLSENMAMESTDVTSVMKDDTMEMSMLEP